MQLLGLILLLASSWYLWKLTSNFLDEPVQFLCDCTEAGIAPLTGMRFL